MKIPSFLLFSIVAVIVVNAADEKVVAPVLDISQPLLGRLNEKPVEQQLPPIQPIFSSFLDQSSIFRNKINNDDDSLPRRHGILTILVIKSKKPATDDNESALLSNDENISKINQFRSQISEGFSKFASLVIKDLFRPTEEDQQQLLIGGGNEDVDRKTVHLLGGRHDIDAAAFNKFNNNEQEDELREEEINDQDQNKSDESNVNSSKFQSILNWLKLRQEQQPAVIEPSFIIKTNDGQSSLINLDEQQQKQKQCMMHSFMRLKASIYYRTILHLLFLTGIMLIIFFMAILTVRVYKRRKALNYYSQNMLNISTIESEKKKTPFNETNETFLFRHGSIRNVFAQKSADFMTTTNTTAAAPPPAYEKLSTNDDSKSLPDYEETSTLNVEKK